MDKETLRSEFGRLRRCSTLQDCVFMLEMYSEYFLKVVLNQQHERLSVMDHDAFLLNQMMLTKILHIKKLIDNGGVGFVSADGTTLNPIVDPTILASLVRNAYETAGLFNLIYIRTKSVEEKSILHALWALSGLKYRQRFSRIAKQAVNQQKLTDEMNKIRVLENDIKSSQLYQSLNQANQNKIDSQIKRKEYRIIFRGNDVDILTWQDLANTLGITQNKFDEMYTYFSMFAHPSNVAVFQFEVMFKRGEEEFKNISTMLLQTFFMFISCFIADYLKLFPSVRRTYESRPLLEQIMFNFFNEIGRGSDYSINDAWKEIEFE